MEDFGETKINQDWASMLGVPLLHLGPTVEILQEQTRHLYGTNTAVAVLNAINNSAKWEEDTILLLSCSQFSKKAITYHSVKALQCAAVFGKTCAALKKKWNVRAKD